jgi:hypothetical protein
MESFALAVVLRLSNPDPAIFKRVAVQEPLDRRADSWFWLDTSARSVQMGKLRAVVG